MTTTVLRKQLGLTPLEEFKFLPPLEPPKAVEVASDDLIQSIRAGTVTVEQIDWFLQQSLQHVPGLKRQDVHEFLLSKKATLLFAQGRQEEGLKHYDQALSVKETPSTWAMKGSALLQLERLDEAFDAFQKSYSLKEDFGPQKQAYLADLLGTWSITALVRGLFGILEQDVREAEKGAFEYIELLNQARRDGLESMVLNLAVERPVSQDVDDALQELEVMIRLLSIEDPFEGWRELGKEISKVWPKGVSAVDAIREQRDREWNR